MIDHLVVPAGCCTQHFNTLFPRKGAVRCDFSDFGTVLDLDTVYDRAVTTIRLVKLTGAASSEESRAQTFDVSRTKSHEANRIALKRAAPSHQTKTRSIYQRPLVGVTEPQDAPVGPTRVNRIVRLAAGIGAQDEPRAP